MRTKLPKIYSVKSVDRDTLKEWLRTLIIGRQLDVRAPNYLKQAIGWSYHAPYAGHDGIQFAIGQIFNRETDHLFPYYRDMMTCFSAGLTAEEIILNGISKDTDVAGGGRHMSNHFAKPEWNIHNVSSSTANHDLHAVGVARAMKYYGSKGVSITSHGESSTSEGYVYEAVNGATREKLPVIFVFQDNGYGISVPKHMQTANRKAANNFSGFKNLRIIHCNGKDVFDSMNAMVEAKKHVLEHGEPVIVQANCIRMESHSNSDRQELYRSENECNYTRVYDPLAKFVRMVKRYNRFTEEEISAIEEEAKLIVKTAHKKALAAPNPDPASIFDFVIAEPYKAKEIENKNDGEKLTLVLAINKTLKEEFRLNPDTFIYGQDVANKEKGGAFNVTKGMQQEFGASRVWSAPIAEDYIVGTANGMSRYNDKLRVIVEGAEFADYFWPAMENFVDTTHDFWRSKGQFSPNITIRLASGGYIGGGLYHSQNIEGSLSTFPGIRIVYPTFADDAAGLLRTSIRSRGITVFMEPKALYNAPQAAASIPDDFEIPFGKARVRRRGQDLTIVTYGNTLIHSLDAAKELEQDGVNVEVIDLRSLVPWDKETVISSVAKTSKLLVVHEDKVFSGFGGEIAATIQEEAFELLDAPVKRIGAAFTPVGFNRILEAAILPNKQKIIDAVMELIRY
ncbi:MAG: thiamine pyrophosphate-dependent enzyme [Mangrovibacterium sp.]